MKKMLNLYLIGAFISVFDFSPKAQVAPAYFADSLQAILDGSIPSTFSNAGGILGVVVPGQWSWYGASGNAISGMTVGQPITTATALNQFRAGSITKNMISTAILKMEQDGLLSIEHPISMYLRPTLVTDTIASSGIVLIRHLLNHTSGIANSGDNNGCNTTVIGNPLSNYTLEYAINCGASQGELFSPGSNWAYSNTNYSILAMIIREVTGQTAADYITQNIITPLGLLNTEFPTTNQLSNPHMGCYWNIGSWIDLTIINPSVYAGWADVVSTTEDLIIYYDSLLNGAIINAGQLVKMKTIDANANGYGLGMDFYTALGTSFYGHYGEVANTSGLFFVNLSSATTPNGYYISYNFNTQGVNMQGLIDIPVLQFLKNNSAEISENLVNDQFEIYPNPTRNHCRIKLKDIFGKVDISFTDVTGRVVLSQTIANPLNDFSIDLSSMKNGVYWVTLINNSNSSIQKLVID